MPWPALKKEHIAAATGLAALLIAISDVVDKRSEVATLRAEVSSLKLSHDTIRAQNERLFQLAVGVVKDGQIPLLTLQPFLLPGEIKQVSEQVSAFRRETLPVDIDAAYYPSGWMGDGESGKRFVVITRKLIPGTGNNRSTVEVTFLNGPTGWAGIYWQFPASNWGDQLGRNLTGAKLLTFRARGKVGGEIVEFKSGGIRGKKYSDSHEVSLGKVILNQDWAEYRMDLSDQHLSNVIGAFAAFASAADNSGNATTFYLENLRIE